MRAASSIAPLMRGRVVVLGLPSQARRYRNDAESRAKPHFFFAPTRLMLLIASGVRPDFSAISRSCSMM